MSPVPVARGQFLVVDPHRDLHLAACADLDASCGLDTHARAFTLQDLAQLTGIVPDERCEISERDALLSYVLLGLLDGFFHT